MSDSSEFAQGDSPQHIELIGGNPFKTLIIVDANGWATRGIDATEADMLAFCAAVPTQAPLMRLLWRITTPQPAQEGLDERTRIRFMVERHFVGYRPDKRSGYNPEDVRINSATLVDELVARLRAFGREQRNAALEAAALTALDDKPFAHSLSNEQTAGRIADAIRALKEPT